MADLLALLNQHLGGAAAEHLGRQIGADPEQTRRAVSAAVPLLMGALARNANRSPEEARSLARALERDHDGSLLDGLSGLLGGSGGGLGGLLGAAGGLLGGRAAGKATDGDGILGHILGERRGTVEQGVARASGLDVGQVSRLLAALAPLVMGALGKAKRSQNLDPDGLTALLNRERATIEERTEGMQQGSLLQLLDRDDDGAIADDLAKLGGALGKLFG